MALNDENIGFSMPVAPAYNYGGNAGGNLVFAGTPEEIVNCKESYTGKYLKEKLKAYNRK